MKMFFQNINSKMYVIYVFKFMFQINIVNISFHKNEHWVLHYKISQTYHMEFIQYIYIYIYIYIYMYPYFILYFNLIDNYYVILN